VAKEYEKRRKVEMERAGAGLPTDQKATRIRTVAEVTKSLSQWLRVESPDFQRRFCDVRLGVVDRHLGTTVLSDLTKERMRE